MSRKQVHGAAGMRPTAIGFGPRHTESVIYHIAEEGAK